MTTTDARKKKLIRPANRFGFEVVSCMHRREHKKAAMTEFHGIREEICIETLKQIPGSLLQINNFPTPHGSRAHYLRDIGTVECIDYHHPFDSLNDGSTPGFYGPMDESSCRVEFFGDVPLHLVDCILHIGSRLKSVFDTVEIEKTMATKGKMFIRIDARHQMAEIPELQVGKRQLSDSTSHTPQKRLRLDLHAHHPC